MAQANSVMTAAVQKPRNRQRFELSLPQDAHARTQVMHAVSARGGSAYHIVYEDGDESYMPESEARLWAAAFGGEASASDFFATSTKPCVSTTTRRDSLAIMPAVTTSLRTEGSLLQTEGPLTEGPLGDMDADSCSAAPLIVHRAPPPLLQEEQFELADIPAPLPNWGRSNPSITQGPMPPVQRQVPVQRQACHYEPCAKAAQPQLWPMPPVQRPAPQVQAPASACYHAPCAKGVPPQPSTSHLRSRPTQGPMPPRQQAQGSAAWWPQYFPHYPARVTVAQNASGYPPRAAVAYRSSWADSVRAALILVIAFTFAFLLNKTMDYLGQWTGFA